LNGRPSKNCGIPIQLYHPSFGRFLRRAHQDTVEINLKPENYSATHSLFQSSAAIYRNEASRVKEVKEFLENAIGHKFHPLDTDVCGMNPDGIIQVSCGSLHALAAVQEDKNEIGMGRCDPSHQCALDFRLYYATEKVCPFLPFLVSVLVSCVL
jgi:hypothetical protein